MVNGSTKSINVPGTRIWGRTNAPLTDKAKDDILADIGRGKMTYKEIAIKYGVSNNTVGTYAKKRGIISASSAQYQREEAAYRAEKREKEAHTALMKKKLDECDPSTLSLIAERASGSLNTHLAPGEKTAQLPSMLVLSPEIRMIANMFFGEIGDKTTGKIIDAEILGELPAGAHV
jgi:hypothetical protein